jgi:CRISPR system Cascade subunit CasA
VNLLEERWIPVRRASGRSERIAPHEITDQIDSDPAIALDAPRPDFNGALIQFLIGIVQTAWVRADRYWDREDMLWSPPPPYQLHALFSPMREAFELDGDGPRFMQDLSLAPDDDPAENGISALLIDFPGVQSLERNADLFVKRETGGSLCPHCAATALLCLMTNAPGGGAGHRTSIRGGGPLTTLVAYTSAGASRPPPALWRDVACNVISSSIFGAAHLKPPELPEIFPWLRPIDQTMKRSGEVQPLDVHPLQVFWAMPRRIRLGFSGDEMSACALCARAGTQLAARYVTKNYGLNYKGPWQHSLSPYYRRKSTDPLLPVHPQPDGLAYRHWLGWAMGSRRDGGEVLPAAAVQAFHSSRVEPGQMRLWAFGYDMDNMKARCWYEATFPLFDLPRPGGADEAPSRHVADLVDPLVNAAELVAASVRLAVRDAWFGDGEIRGDLGFVEASFWSRTEPEFFQHVQQAIALAGSHGQAAFDHSEPLRRYWLATLQSAALRLFDEVAARGSVEAGNPRKLAGAHRTLRKQLFGDRLQAALALIPAEAVGTSGKSRRGQTKPQTRRGTR